MGEKKIDFHNCTINTFNEAEEIHNHFENASNISNSEVHENHLVEAEVHQEKKPSVFGKIIDGILKN